MESSLHVKMNSPEAARTISPEPPAAGRGKRQRRLPQHFHNFDFDIKEEFSPKRSPSLLQEEPEPPGIKEGQEELLQRPEEPDGSTLTLLAVTSQDENEDISSHVEVQLEPDTEDSDDWEESSESDTEDSDSREEYGGGVSSRSSETHICTHCEKGFITTMGFKTHQCDAHVGEKPFQCKPEEPDGSTLTLLAVTSEDENEDISSHVEKKKEKRFSQAGFLKTHESIHTGEIPLQCKHCDKSYLYPHDLKRHQLTHTGEKRFQCKHCDKNYRHAGSLKTHQSIHTGEKPFQCKHCNRGFTRAFSLKSHERIHTYREKPFQCEHCGKSFHALNLLKSHQVTHTAEKPFQCNQCDKSFSRFNYLNYHKRSHTGERRFHCTYCDKRFIQNRELKIHQRIHTGEKPFQCKLCDKSFCQLNSLNYHQRCHTADKPLKESFSQLTSLKAKGKNIAASSDKAGPTRKKQ